MSLSGELPGAPLRHPVQFCVTTETEEALSTLYVLANDGSFWWNVLDDGIFPQGWRELKTGPLPQSGALPGRDES